MTTEKPRQGFSGLWNISFGFFGIQIGFALQNSNMSRIFQTLGSSLDDLPALWVAAPLTGLLVQPIVGYMIALFVGTVLVAAIPWISTGFL